MIDHSGHPHPSTPAARALCRANGGTGSTAKTGTKVPDAPRALAKASSVKVPALTAPKVPVPKVAAAPIASIPRGRRIEGTITDTPAKAKKTTAKVPTTPAATSKPVSAPIAILIPEAPGKGAKVRIQNALRAGKTRNEIVEDERSVLGYNGSHAVIDSLMTKYNLPPGERDRINNTGKGPASVPVAAAVVPAEPPKREPGVVPGGRVEAPSGPPSAAVTRLEAKVSKGTTRKMRERVTRVGAIQEVVVGADVLDKSINSITSAKTSKDMPRGLEKANATFTYGPKLMTLHSQLENRKYDMAHARCGHAKVRGGDDPIETTIAHEMGHAFIDNTRFTPEGTQEFMDKVSQILDLSTPVPRVGRGSGLLDPFTGMERWWVGVTKNTPGDRHKINTKVSQYAATNINEFMAEVWADYTMNPKPSPTTRALGDMLKGFITKTGPVKALGR